jgi:hypothetical protein
MDLKESSNKNNKKLDPNLNAAASLFLNQAMLAYSIELAIEKIPLHNQSGSASAVRYAK